MLAGASTAALRAAVASKATACAYVASNRLFSASAPRLAEHTFELGEYHLHKIPDAGPAQQSTVTSEQLLDWYRQMTVIRRMETAAADLYKTKFVRGFCHLYSGQEAVAAGMESILLPTDSIITSYRAHGWCYLKGASVLGVLAELLGRSAGVSMGKGGSMHMYWENFYGGNGIVGAQVPLGAGIAFAHKYKNDGGVSVALYGDGAANQGQLYEAFNIAKLWSIPAIFVCENNRYGMGTSQERSSASFTYYTRGDYIPGIQVNGMDLLHVREATRYAADWCRSGKGPIILEMVTYRYGGHSMSDPGTSYRTREEIKKMKQSSDPIQGLKIRGLETGLATEEQFKEIDQAVKKEVDKAVEDAKASPEIPLSEIPEHCYVKPIQRIRGQEPTQTYTPRDYQAPY